MRSAHVPDALRSGPFTTAMAAAHGVTRSALRGTQWRHVFRDVWAHVDLPDSRAMRLAAVRLVLPVGAFVCGLTAAWLHGIDVQDRRSDLVWIGCRTGRHLRHRPGCLVREITVDDQDLQELDGLLVTTPLRTAFDCGRWLSLIEGTVVADALSHEELFTPADLMGYWRTHRGLRGVRQVRRICDLMESKAESPMETRVRLLLVLSGLPQPEAQLIVLDQLGRFVARADLGYKYARHLIEYDGADHWEQRRADDRRRHAMRELGWTVLVVSRDDYYKTPQQIVETVRRELAKHHEPSKEGV